MIIKIRKLLGYLGFNYCIYCGSKLVFDQVKFDLGYSRVFHKCPHCDYLDRFRIHIIK